jgi:sterol desaturase/sphingolipid hydroxylase (fatty acid hydroxylase superfamily)
LEAILENAILFMALIIPIHPFAFLAFGLFQISWNITGHLGFEIFPSGFTKHPITRWFNSSTHHNMHHRLVKCNYGLYFNFWDTIMGSNHAKYHEEFEKVATSKHVYIQTKLSE